ncbi:hypothetical protein ACMFMG_008479 [Clarireedia jacksonii]
MADQQHRQRNHHRNDRGDNRHTQREGHEHNGFRRRREEASSNSNSTHRAPVGADSQTGMCEICEPGHAAILLSKLENHYQITYKDSVKAEAARRSYKDKKKLESKKIASNRETIRRHEAEVDKLPGFRTFKNSKHGTPSVNIIQ